MIQSVSRNSTSVPATVLALAAIGLIGWGLWASTPAAASPLEPPIPGPSIPKMVTAPVPDGPFAPVFRRLLERGADLDFIRALGRDPNLKFEEKLVRVNVLNFSIPSRYENFLTRTSVEQCRSFLERYRKTFSKCELRYRVPKEVIASLLWIETKHGRDTGTRHVASVFLNLALADRPDAVQQSLQNLKESFPESDPKFPELKQKVLTRSKTKAEWAIQELLALEKIWKGRKIDISSLTGSVSGAFGISQFVPSSYVQWAKDGNGDGKADLFSPQDAICSVGNYLRKNGWGRAPASRQQALYHYNRSTEYGDTILKLSKLVKARKKRGRHVASEPMIGPGFWNENFDLDDAIVPPAQPGSGDGEDGVTTSR